MNRIIIAIAIAIAIAMHLIYLSIHAEKYKQNKKTKNNKQNAKTKQNKTKITTYIPILYTDIT
jgi:hypothetical protein